MICRGIHGGVPLVMSAHDVSRMRERAMAWGVCGFMSRPLCRSEVVDCMNRCRVGKELMRPDTRLVKLKKKPGQPNAEPLDFTGNQVLLAEDNELNREITLELLGGFRMKLEAAANGRKALKHFEEGRPGYYSSILMDIQMPVVSRHEAAHATRSLSREDVKTVSILATTTDTFVEGIENTKTAGMNGHPVKPLDFKQFVREVEQYPHV